ncbi:hypothetical protein GGR51DRAFT_570761 [Nemania sp. FL0031]|nr:hypothetical protein GGR51DRAFT_570761 [Nemania sp. FL0031]
MAAPSGQSGQQSGGSDPSTTQGSDHTKLTLNIGTGKLGKKSNGNQVEITGRWDIVSICAEPFDGTTQAQVTLLPSNAYSEQPCSEGSSNQIQLNGPLSSLSTVLGLFGRDTEAQLTLLYSNVPKQSNKKRRIDHEVNTKEQDIRPERNEQDKIQVNDAKKVNPRLCGNCGRNDHKAAVCVKAGKSGWMEACCKCDSRQHTYEHCPHRKQDQDFKYLIVNRGNKCPVKCSLHLGRVVVLELTRPGTLVRAESVVALPYSTVFARHYAKNFTNEVKTWDYTKDTSSRLCEVVRYKQPLDRAVSILGDQHWTNEDQVAENAERCDNCGWIGHSEYECLHSCGFCGSKTHRTMFCDSKHKACLCQKYPKHSRSFAIKFPTALSVVITVVVRLTEWVGVPKLRI